MTKMMKKEIENLFEREREREGEGKELYIHMFNYIYIYLKFFKYNMYMCVLS